MQTTITIHISDSEFGLKRTDLCHVVSDDDGVAMFLPIGMQIDMPLKDWLSVSKSDNPQAYIGSFIVDNVRNSQWDSFLRVVVENDNATLRLTTTLELEISIADWRKVADRIVLEILNA